MWIYVDEWTFRYADVSAELWWLDLGCLSICEVLAFFEIFDRIFVFVVEHLAIITVRFAFTITAVKA